MFFVYILLSVYVFFLVKLSLAKLCIAGNCALTINHIIIEVEIGELEEVGDDFMAENDSVKVFKAPHLQRTGEAFFYMNDEIRNAYLRLCVKIFFRIGNGNYLNYLYNF